MKKSRYKIACRRRIFWTLFIGSGAVAGAMAMLIDPSGKALGMDATARIKSTCFNMAKSGYTVHVLSDCITSYDKKKLPEMLEYYEQKGCGVESFCEVRV